MNEYTRAFLAPFSWAKSAYNYMLGVSTTQEVQVKAEDLVNPITTKVNSSDQITIDTSQDWNSFSLHAVGDLAGLYATIDRADQYVETLSQKYRSSIQAGEDRVLKLESSLRSIRSSLANTANTSVSISGGDGSWVDKNPRFYVDFPSLSFAREEGCYRLPDTGTFSSLRSNGGFAGQAVIEKTLAPIQQNGPIEAITDGSSASFWMGTSYFPSLVRVASGDISWLPSNYTHGSAMLLTYYMDRPTLVGEIFIDPVSTEPFKLLSVSWTPLNERNCLINPSYTVSSSGWTLTQGTYMSSGLGVSSCLLQSVSGLISQSFNITNSYALSLSGTPTASGLTTGQRFELQYSMATVGDCAAGARIKWFNAGGDVIGSDSNPELFPNFYKSSRLVSYSPTGAVSGTVDFLIFSATSSASAFVSQAKLFAGEQRWQCNEKIERPTTISLPKSITTSRFSFVIQQTAPRRETLNKTKDTELLFNEGLPAETPTFLTNSINKTIEELNSNGNGHTVFAYRFGMRELDLRYTEYVPRAGLVSIPLETKKEIRNIWVTADMEANQSQGLGFYIIPFDKDETFKIPVKPYRTGDVDTSGQTIRSEGDIVSIFTTEEEEAGWAANVAYRIISDPIKTTEVFDGTDRDGKIVLQKVPHLRRVKIRDIKSWLSTYSIWPTSFDPNIQIPTGIGSSILRTAIREGLLQQGGRSNISGDSQTNGIPLGMPDTLAVTRDDVVSTEGYLPVKLTISTGKWTAYPDTFGRPDSSRVRDVLKELLEMTPVTESIVDVTANYITYEQFIARTKVAELGVLFTGSGGAFNAPKGNLTIKEYLDTQNTIGFNNNLVEQQAKKEYEQRKANGLLPKNENSTQTRTSSLESGDSYRTRFSPVITGPAGTVFRAYWYDPITLEARLIPSNDYKLDANMGLLTLKNSPPSTNFTDIVADYKYISKSEEEDFFSEAIAFVSTVASGNEDIGITSRRLPITRNMTDYVTGRVPSLKTPDFDRMSKDYYPVIEYYVTPDGDIQCSRDFFKYGDQPATLTVEYETLGVRPRLEVAAYRSSGPTVTPKLLGASMRTKEGSPSPLREI